MPRINPIDNFFTRIAKSKFGKSVYKKLLDPKKEGLYAVTIPIVESVAAGAIYDFNIKTQKKIDDKSKSAMRWQNVITTGVSVAISIPMNKFLTSVSDGVIKELDKTKVNINDLHKVKNGLVVALPLVAVTVLNRFLLPSIATPVSSIIRDKKKEKVNTTV